MNPNSTKNRKLIRQYPFVADIMRGWLEPYNYWVRSPSEALKVDDLTIQVQKADGDLMFRRANNVGLGDSSCVFQISEKRKDQVMRRGEYIFAVDADDVIINRVAFPRNAAEGKLSGNVYAWSVLWATKNGQTYSNPIWDKVKYLVWVTVEAWHADTKDDNAPGGRFGDFRDRSMKITIYGAPSQGFEKLQEESNVYTNLSLDSRLMIEGAIDNNYDIIAMSGMLSELCIMFQDEVYFNGMKDAFYAGKYRGASGQFGSVRVLCAEMCGYDRVMLEDDTSYVTFQLRPDSKNLYVLGQSGTLPRIRNLVRTVVRMWNQNPESRAAFKSDKDVSVA